MSSRRYIQPSFPASDDCSIEHDKSKLCPRHNLVPGILQSFAYSVVIGLCARRTVAHIGEDTVAFVLDECE